MKFFVSNYVTETTINKALVMSRIVWLVSKLYLFMFGSDTEFSFSKNAVFVKTDPRSRDADPKQLLKPIYQLTKFNFNHYYG